MKDMRYPTTLVPALNVVIIWAIGRGEIIWALAWGSGFIDGCRFSNTTNMKDYLTLENGAQGWYSETEHLSRKAKMEEFMFLGLRMRDGFYRDEFTQLLAFRLSSLRRCIDHLQQEELLLKT